MQNQVEILKQLNFYMIKKVDVNKGFSPGLL